jgi:hypothetical protein
VEWPIFALLAIAGWWHLVHEDPEAFRARRWRSTRRERQRAGGGTVDATETLAPVDVDAVAVRWAPMLAIATGVELVVGIAALVLIPFGRPAGWLPAHGAAIYGIHASFGLALGLGAAAFLVRVGRGGRIARLVGWLGAVGIVVAAAGGLLTEAQSVTRFFGICVMFLGTALALGAYLIPTALAARTRALQPARERSSQPATGEPAGEGNDPRA